MRQELPELTWEIAAEALRAAEQLDGYYVLLTSLPAERAGNAAVTEAAEPSAVLRRWKAQWKIERRFHEWKGPL